MIMVLLPDVSAPAFTIAVTSCLAVVLRIFCCYCSHCKPHVMLLMMLPSLATAFFILLSVVIAITAH